MQNMVGKMHKIHENPVITRLIPVITIAAVVLVLISF